MWKEDRVYSLGIWYCINPDLSESLNYGSRLDNMRKVLNIWSMRDLSLKGRITVLKTFALPKLLYICSNLAVPEWFVKQVNDLSFKFIWSGKPDKIKRKTIIAPIEKGGLKMIDFEAMVKAQKISWIKRLISDDEASWKAFPRWLAGFMDLKDLIKCHFQPSKIPSIFTQFYHQIFHAWNEVNPYEINNAWDVRRQCVFYNRNIMIDNSYISNNYEDFYRSGIKIIHDILNERGLFLSPAQIFEKYGLQVNTMKFNSLKDAVPNHWRATLKSSVVYQSAISSEESPFLVINKTLKPVGLISNKDIYSQIIEPIIVQPICIAKWNNLLDSKIETWKNIFMLPFKTVRETKIQTFQYKILHQIYPCNVYVSKWNKEVSSTCCYCDEPDTLMHFFAECKGLASFWRSFTNWWNNNTEDKLSLSTENIIFGKLDRDHHTSALNFCLLLAKWYIGKQKYLKQEIFFYTFQVDLKRRLSIEEFICKKNNDFVSFEAKFGLLLTALE